MVEKNAETSLTSANWTPDIVAGTLGVSISFTLGILISFIQLLLHDTAVYIFLTIITFAVAYAYAKICFHMELTGRRYFQQAFSLLTPTVLGFFSTSMLQLAWNSTIANKAVNAPGALSMVVPAFTIPAVAQITVASTILWTSLLALAIVAPFVIISVQNHWLKWYYFLYLLIPIVLCGLILVGVSIGLSTAKLI